MISDLGKMINLLGKGGCVFGSVCLFVCLCLFLFVCLLATLLKMLHTDCGEIIWKGNGW